MSMQTIDSVRGLAAECSRRRNQINARVTAIPLDDLRRWKFTTDGSLAHDTGRFFRVMGVRTNNPTRPTATLEHPIIDQPEVGVLCLFVTRIGSEIHGLVTFKFEPGTPDGIEVAPSVQATRSNYESAHGGVAVPAVELALEETPSIADALQREQESWFAGKVNRNRILMLDHAIALDVGRSVPDSVWVPVDVLLAASLRSRLLNMDLRSILSMWPSDQDPTAVAPAPVHTPCARRADIEEIPLRALTGWEVNDTIERVDRRYFSIVGRRIESAPDREVPSWDQPLLAPVGMGQCTLLVRHDHGDGLVEALVTERERVGSIRGVTLEPTHQRGDVTDCSTETRRAAMLAEASDLARCERIWSAVHSEEGGRFSGALVTYQIGLVPDTYPQPPDKQWVSLDKIDTAIGHGDRVSVELRTCITMLKALLRSEGWLA
ncbi:hypothetical protein BO226_24645 (plasmid) [Rhodococcus sp. 2G]|uniref:NDP-hexose 2,3-dehydratase family protein n=1 Tax=Rhodococcus sp. 2G TaxID=1570939 RepID=UPI000903997F|nr:NDP-hexose 2,3-dehydratase family protein [Rhodococcus sp. 2G]APE12556.1 hypothetical protein BO226_24645 [Rhodococcus sp. 2G]